MASLKGLVLLFTVRVALVASLKTKDLRKNAGPFEDLFKLWHAKVVKDETVALASTSAAIAKAPMEKTARKTRGGKPGKNVPDWCSAKVTSNLGGVGPDTSEAVELRYSNIPGIITSENVDAIDLVVTNLTDYKSKNPDVNGFNNGGQNSNNGCFAIINLDDSEGTNSVDLEFKFVNSSTNDPVHVNTFGFQLFDMDTGKDGTAIESMTVYSDIQNAFTYPGAKMTRSGDLRSPTGLTFTATDAGDGADNPTSPFDLTKEQKLKEFLGYYKGVASFKITFSVTGGSGGRNFMFAGMSPPAIPEGCPTESCVIWGDPHVLTFDAHREFTFLHPNPGAFFQSRNRRHDTVNVLEEGSFWLVKSDDIHIQGRYNKLPHQNTTVLGGLAVGGPFLEGNTFIVRPLVGKITWNGEEVLSKLGSEFSNSLVDARYRAGVENVMDGSKGNGLEVTLPGDVKLIVNRRTRGLAVKISMCAREWQDGQCGNFNGDSTDDAQDVLMQRVKPLHHKEALPWRQHLHPADISKRLS